MADPLQPRIEKRSPLKLYLWGALILVAAIFIGLNSQTVKVDFLFGTTTMPLVFALLITGLLGFAIGWATPKVRRGNRLERKLDEDNN